MAENTPAMMMDCIRRKKVRPLGKQAPTYKPNVPTHSLPDLATRSIQKCLYGRLKSMLQGDALHVLIFKEHRGLEENDCI